VKRLIFALLAAAGAIALVAPSSPGATSVAVTGKEFKFTLSPKSAKAGSVTFRFTNRGKVKHDFKIAGKKTKLIGPGKSATLKVTLKKGSAPYLCTVPGHAASGMKGKLTVS
jgi:plastocyanin